MRAAKMPDTFYEDIYADGGNQVKAIILMGQDAEDYETIREDLRLAQGRIDDLEGEIDSVYAEAEERTECLLKSLSEARKNAEAFRVEAINADAAKRISSLEARLRITEDYLELTKRASAKALERLQNVWVALNTLPLADAYPGDAMNQLEYLAENVRNRGEVMFADWLENLIKAVRGTLDE